MQGPLSIAGRRRKWFRPGCFSLPPSALALQKSAAMLINRGCHKTPASVLSWGSILVRSYGQVGEYIFLHKAHQPQACKQHQFKLQTMHLPWNWPFPVAAWVQHSPALNKISSNLDHAYKCGHSVGYLARELCLHPSCCDSFPCLFYNCMLLNLSSVLKILTLAMERDTRDPSVYVKGSKNRRTDTTTSCFAYASHANPTGKW